ncbi:MAG: hypothetical protein ACT4PS_07400 [Betaproteobacteria bacterium]
MMLARGVGAAYRLVTDDLLMEAEGPGQQILDFMRAATQAAFNASLQLANA